jgi:chromosome segregation ATPase
VIPSEEPGEVSPREPRRWVKPVLASVGGILAIAAGYFGVVAYQLQEQVAELTETSLDLGTDLAEERAVTASQEEAIRTLADEVADLEAENDALATEIEFATSIARLLSDCADNVDTLVELVQVSKYYRLTPDIAAYQDSVKAVCSSAQTAGARLLDD